MSALAPMPEHPQLGKPREVYEYTDADGAIVFVVCRFDPKAFRQARPTATGWAWDLDGIEQPPLYRLPHILDALWIGERIWIAEGEKDVDALELLGRYATCNPMGAGKWRPWHTEAIARARSVTIVADHDAPGLAHALAVRADLAAAGVAVIDVVYPASGKDARDHYDALLSEDDFVPVQLDDEPGERDTWQPLNLGELPERPPTTPTLGDVGIVYPGMRHVFSGAPESAKTIAAYVIGLYVVRSGEPVILIDFEMGAYDARSRLRELGASNEDLAGIRYLEPDEPATYERIAALADIKPALVVIDAAAGAYDLQGLDDNKRADVEKLARLYVAPFWHRGVATIFIDHVVKNSETRGHYAIGSERKLGGADVHLGFETIAAISRGTSGRYKITTHKDRGGYLKRGHLLDLVLESDADTHRISAEFVTAVEGGTGPDESVYFRPTNLMEKASAWVELQIAPVSRNDVVVALGGRKAYVLKAISALVAEGFFEETEGPRRTRFVASSRKYRESDPDCNPPLVPVVPTGSPLVPGTSLPSGSPSSSPLEGGTRETLATGNRSSGAVVPVQSSWLDDDLAYLDGVVGEEDPAE